MDTHLLDLFMVESPSTIALGETKNPLELTVEYGKLLAKYKEPVDSMLKLLSSRLEFLVSQHKLAMSSLKKDIIEPVGDTNDGFILIKKEKAPKKIKVDIFGKTLYLPKLSYPMKEGTVYFCTRRNVLLYNFMSNTIYFSYPTNYETIEHTVDCNSDYCKKLPDKHCTFYHRPEYYGRYYSSKSYINLYLPKPLGHINTKIIVDYVLSNTKLSDAQLNVLKDYASFLMFAYVALGPESDCR